MSKNKGYKTQGGTVQNNKPYSRADALGFDAAEYARKYQRSASNLPDDCLNHEELSNIETSRNFSVKLKKERYEELSKLRDSHNISTKMDAITR